MLKQLENSQSCASTFLHATVQSYSPLSLLQFISGKAVNDTQFPCLYIVYSMYKNVSIIDLGGVKGIL